MPVNVFILELHIDGITTTIQQQMKGDKDDVI